MGIDSSAAVYSDRGADIVMQSSGYQYSGRSR
jgi:hypothetical protein